MSKLFSAALLLLATTGIASALVLTSTTAVVRAPEIDPASALSGLTLLLGSLAVVRGRRAK
jgi:hypothetical protein